MKTNNEQEQMIKEEFEMAWKAYLSELRIKGFSDKFIEMEKTGKWLPQLWFIKGRMKSLRDTKELIDDAKKICDINTELNLRLQEKEQEIETLNKENSLLYRSHNKICEQLDHGEHLDIEWVKSIIQEEVTHPVITSSLRMMNIYKSKLPDQDKLREALEYLTLLDNILIYTAKEDDFMHKIDYLKTFLESLGEK